MRLLLVVSLCAARAWAIDDCVAGEKQINLDNGSSTADYTGLVRCFDRDTKEETRSMTYLRGKLNGREKRKWSNGTAMEQEYRDGKRHGEYRKYEDGKLVEVSHYVDDRELGEAVYYSKTGKVTRKVDRREPESTSTWQKFDDAGRLTEAGCGQQVTWPAGLKDCKWSGPSPLVFFHPDGKKHQVIALKDGLREGLTTVFNAQGVKLAEENYAKGLRNGKSTEFFESGKPSHITDYVGGQKENEEIEFFPDGQTKKVSVRKFAEYFRDTEYFQNGSKKSERVSQALRDPVYDWQTTESKFDDEGRLVDRFVDTGKQHKGLHERFFPDGGAQLREELLDKKPQGRRQLWFENGHPDEDSQWDKGRVTSRKRWDPDGGVIEDEAFYEDGSRKKKQ